jgi:hypothetical protein
MIRASNQPFLPRQVRARHYQRYSTPSSGLCCDVYLHLCRLLEKGQGAVEESDGIWRGDGSLI